MTLFPEYTCGQEAIAFIKKHEPPEGYYLGFSGGKDSVVVYDLAKKANVKFQAYYAATGIDPPEITKFIKTNYSDVIWKHPKKSFFHLVANMGYPTMQNRWCCTYLKKAPLDKIPLKHRLVGIRKEESSKRASRPMIDEYKSTNQIMYKPIFHWKEWQVWEYIENHVLNVCSLYDEGFSRLGCVVCPVHCGNEKRLALHKNRWPKMYYAFEKAMARLFYDKLCIYNKRAGSYNYIRIDFMTLEEFITAWYQRKTIMIHKKGNKQYGLFD